MTAYTLWQQGAVSGSAGASAPRTLATQFQVSQACALNAVWWYSPAGAAVLPSACGIWDVTAQSVITEDATPNWLTPGGAVGTAGGGWLRCDMSAAAVTLPAGLPYAVAVFQPAAASWYSTSSGYWTTGAGAGGLTSGPLFAPPQAGAVNGQGCYDATGTWAFPATSGAGASFYADAEVTGLGSPGRFRAYLADSGPVALSGTSPVPVLYLAAPAVDDCSIMRIRVTAEAMSAPALPGSGSVLARLCAVTGTVSGGSPVIPVPLSGAAMAANTTWTAGPVTGITQGAEVWSGEIPLVPGGRAAGRFPPGMEIGVPAGGTYAFWCTAAAGAGSGLAARACAWFAE